MANSVRGISLLCLAVPLWWAAGPCVADGQSKDALGETAILRTPREVKSIDLRAESVCIEKVSGAIELVVVGIRDRELVCHLDGVFVGSVYFERARPDWAAKALDVLGWANAPWQMRVRVATLWVEEVVFAFTAKFERAFRGSADDDGTIKVIVSVKLPPGITSRSAPKTFSFDAKGKMFGAEINELY